MSEPPCKGCKRKTHPAYVKRYGGYCLECSNAGVPERDDEIARLRAVIHELCECRREFDSLGDPGYTVQQEHVRRTIAAWDAAMKVDKEGR